MMKVSQWNNTLTRGYEFLILACIVSLFLPIAFNSMCIGLLGLLWLFSGSWKRLGDKGTLSQVGILMLAFYLIHILGLLYTSNMSEGLKELEQKMAYLVLPLFILSGPLWSKDFLAKALRTFYHTCSLVLLGAILFGFLRYFTYETGFDLMNLLTYRDLTLPVGFDPIYLGLYTAAALFFILFDKVIALDLRTWRSPRLRVSGQILLLFFGLIFISSRAEILVFGVIAAGLTIVLVVRSRGGYRPVVVLGAIFALAIGLVASSPVNRQRFKELIDMDADYTENQYGGRSFRLAKWNNAIQTWSRAPLMGHGTGDVMDELMDTYKANDFMEAYNGYYNPHNQYLQTALGFGLIGVLLLLALIASQIRNGYRSAHYLYIAFVLLYALSMMSESMLERQKGIVFIVLFSCLFDMGIRTLRVET